MAPEADITIPHFRLHETTHPSRDLFQVEYVNEGAANVVYRLQSFDGKQTYFSSGSTTLAQVIYDDDLRALNLDSKLLRINKKSEKTMPAYNIYEFYVERIMGEFEEGDILDCWLVSLQLRLVLNLNQQLQTNRERSELRRDSTLRLDKYGLIVTDMSAKEPFPAMMIEIKPKWLVQSPTAPEDATRCRTCAFKVKKFDKLKEKNPLAQPNRLDLWCPLKLASGHREFVRAVMVQLIHQALNERGASWGCHPDVFDRLLDNLTEFFTKGKGHRLLTKLSNHQACFDQYGIRELRRNCHTFYATQEDALKCCAESMTLRDCSLFVRTTASGEIDDARLGDLDPKSLEKQQYWDDVECELIQQGYYVGNNLSGSPWTNYCMLGGAPVPWNV